MSVEAIQASCVWCESEATFSGENPEEEWRHSGWLIRLDEEGGEREYCGLACAISDA